MKVPTVCIDRIKELAKQEGLTLKFFSDRFGKKQSYFGDIRNGKNRLDDSELAFIADRLHTTTDYLTGATDDPSQPAQPDAPAPSADDDAVTPEFLATLSPSTRQIYEMVESLPDDKRQEAIDYIQFIISRSEKQPPKQK